MSSTNRSKARENHVADYYVTPHKPIEDLIKWMSNKEEFNRLFLNNSMFKPDIKFFDPCAGGNPSSNERGMVPMSYPTVFGKHGVNMETNDIRDDSLAQIKSDYINSDVIENRADVIITNPPFNCAVDIIKKAQKEVSEGGYVIMLLRLNFFGSKDRKPFWDNNMPIYSVVHHQRISFTKGSTDSIEYMHAIWKSGVSQNNTTLELI
jgi:hypothetical protein